jgi:hypothetical protein
MMRARMLGVVKIRRPRLARVAGRATAVWQAGTIRNARTTGLLEGDGVSLQAQDRRVLAAPRWAKCRCCSVSTVDEVNMGAELAAANGSHLLGIQVGPDVLRRDADDRAGRNRQEQTGARWAALGARWEHAGGRRGA